MYDITLIAVILVDHILSGILDHSYIHIWQFCKFINFSFQLLHLQWLVLQDNEFPVVKKINITEIGTKSKRSLQAILITF